MDTIVTWILSIEALFIGGCLIALVYLIAKRIEDKKNEDFGDRDN